MSDRNPFAISFGRIPNLFISRDIIIQDILDKLNSDVVEEQAFKLTGILGTGKTVTLTAIERELKQDESWIVVDLKSGSDLMQDLLSNLYSEVSFITKHIDASLNLSAFGIGLDIKKNIPTTSLDVAIKSVLKEIKRKNKRILVAIDEVRKTDSLVDFIQEFQILIRDELPIYLIVAGLYEDIESVENTDGLTFFLRAEKHEMNPLSLNIIKESYKQTLNLPGDTAEKLAHLTKGYAFAYQAFGMYMWQSHGKEITDMVLAQVDYALSEKVYNKIWSELSPKDKWYLQYIVKKDTMSVSDLLETTKKNHNEWSGSRKRLIEKGIIDGKIRGNISVCLPRFKEYVESRYMENE